MHDSALLVRRCYDRVYLMEAERRGRRQIAGDGATEVTADALRRSMTFSERTLWARLRPGVLGNSFTLQVPLLGYVVDFYCERLRLAVEVDGRSHRGREHADRSRQDDLEANHIAVVRIPAALVVRDVAAAYRLVEDAVRRQRRRVVSRRRRRPAISPGPASICRHGNDALLCQRCQRVQQLVVERAAPPDVERPPERRRGHGGGRYTGVPGQSQPPAPPGTASSQNMQRQPHSVTPD